MKMRILAGLVVIGLVVGLSLAVAVANGMLGSGDAPAPTPLGEQAAITADAVESHPAPNAPAATGLGATAMEQAAKDKKYLFAVFWRNEDEQTAAMKEVVSATVSTMPDRAASVAVHVADRAESSLVEKFGLNRAPMPLVLAIAPSGAVTGGFPNRCEKEDLLGAFVSPAAEQTMKALQDGNVVLLCVQNQSTKQNDEALKGVNAFQSDPRFRTASMRVMLDPKDAAEVSFLSDLQVDSDTETAKTLVLVPPGSIVASLDGATTKEDVLAALRSAPGCGPGGCGPSGCGPR